MRRAQLYREARRLVEGRRQAAQRAAEARRSAAYTAEPRLAGLDAEITAAGVAAALLAADGHTAEAREKTEARHRLTAEKEALLKAMGLEPVALRPAYSCPLCSDTGEQNGKVCDCVRKEALRLRREEINLAGSLGLCRFENFSLDHYPEWVEDDEGKQQSARANMALILEDCRAWAEEFGPRSQSLYMFGNAGLGKTHLALSIAQRVLEQGHDVIYVSAQRAFDIISEGADGGEMFYSMLEAELLVLDDLGSEYLNAFTRGKLYDLVNARMGRRPTIYTSNICNQALLTRRYDEKISSRLMGDCYRVRFWGQDIRPKKNHA